MLTKIWYDTLCSPFVTYAHDSQDLDDKQWNTYVIKSYRTPDAEIYYNTELSALKKLRYDEQPAPNIIEFYANFQYGGTYNIVLEYADLGTLEDYMQETPPPFSASHQMLFWRNLLDLGYGLLTIHGKEENHKNVPQIMLG